LRRGGLASTFLNAANEIAVEAFLGQKLGFLDIARAVEATLEECGSRAPNMAAASLDTVLAADSMARELAGNICRNMVA
jgi:1-deoxy-D-xylulose-5-phosphate reductoisomerase